MKKIEITKANRTLAEYTRTMGKEPVIVTVDGRPVTALLDISDVDWEEADLRALPVFVASLEVIIEKMKANNSIPSPEARMLLGVPPYGMTEDARFANLLVDDDEMVGVATTRGASGWQDNNEVETPKEEEVANAS